MSLNEIIEIKDITDSEPINIGNSMNSDHNNSKPLKLNFSQQPSVNFGGGAEFLMNDKKKDSKKSDIDIGDINELEKELNGLKSSESKINQQLASLSNELQQKENIIKILANGNIRVRNVNILVPEV